MGRGMSLEEFKNALASDATVENEKLKSELENLKAESEEKVEKLESELEKYKDWCKCLGNRCYVQTGGLLCMSCGVHCCDHAFSEEDYDAAVRYMTQNKMPRNADTYEKVSQFMQERREKRRKDRNKPHSK